MIMITTSTSRILMHMKQLKRKYIDFLETNPESWWFNLLDLDMFVKARLFLAGKPQKLLAAYWLLFKRNLKMPELLPTPEARGAAKA